MRAQVLGVLVAAVASASSAHAFVPDREPPEVATGRTPRTIRSIDPVTNAPAGWRAFRDADTGVVLQMWGGYVEVPGAMLDPTIAERAARAFFAQHAELLAPGVQRDDLRVVSNRVDGSLRTVGFQQTWRGLRVVGGQLHVVFQNDRLFVAGSEALPGVQLTVPRARSVVTTRAAAWMRGEVGTDVTLRDTGERVVLPLVYGRGDIAYHIADVLDARAGHGRWDVFVAPDGTPLLRRNRVHAATGTLYYNTGIRYPLDVRTIRVAPRASITADGAATTTADDGSFTWAGDTAATVVPGLVGNFVRVINEAGALATASLTAQPGLSVVWSLASDELGDAQVSAYVYAMIAKARGRQIHPTLGFLDQLLEVHVNTGGACNAFSTGDSIHFLRANATCENTARLADVVYHEFGHSFHNHAIIPGAGAMHSSIVEGIADFYAANIVDDSGMGRGFDRTNAPLRELDPPIEKKFPADVSPSPHATGLIIGGTLWDLRKAMIAKLGATQGVITTDKLFLGIMQRAPDLSSTYVAALTADDDDGNLANGTPNYCTIFDAFERHGLAVEVVTTRVLPPVVDGTTVTATAIVPPGACRPSAGVTAMTLTWHGANETQGDVAMMPQGSSWSASFPAQPDGTVLRYSVTASIDDGRVVRFPDNPADPLYQHYIGPSTPIWCEHFDNDPSWNTVGAPVWEVAPAAGGIGDPSSAFAGVNVLGTNVRGDGSYGLGISTRVDSPLIDASGYRAVHLQFRRWLTIEDAKWDEAMVRVNNNTTLWTNLRTPDGVVDHNDYEWRFVDIDLSELAGDPLVISWLLNSDARRSLGGWSLDEICVVGVDPSQCGDGRHDVSEGCDDGNAEDGDGCSATCEREPDAGCCSAGSDPTGSVLLGFGVLGWLARRRRSRV